MTADRLQDENAGLDVAIIGMDGRFPGAGSLSEFWANLAAGKESTSPISEADFIRGGGDPDRWSDPSLVRREAALDNIDQFDAAFFGYRGPDAEAIDPQHRLFLECAYHALEQAGYAHDRYEGSIGVYAGAGTSRYLLFNVLPSLSRTTDSIGQLLAIAGSATGSLATRVSYALNLKGPSVAVHTACSTSLVAVHMACQDLLSHRCDVALAGGVFVNPTPKRGYQYVKDGPLSADGHCRAFDAQASGIFPGDGVGAVVLKRLADAIADGDHIRAVIRGSAVNNDGNRKVGYTAPSVQGQSEVILAAQAIAGVDANSIDYIEAHGTATPVGDPIELAALRQAFSATTDHRQFCAIGSLKTNVGHLDAAAGVAALIKVVLSLEHELLPASLHFDQPNPLIDFANSPFYVNATLAPWKAGARVRRAGVSSFGIGGTNAHVIVEEAPSLPASSPPPPWSLLVLSAMTPAALDATAAALGRHLAEHPDLNIADVAYTLQGRRRAFSYRRAIVCRDTRDAAEQLLARPAPSREAGSCQVVFMFPGAGSEYPNMARELYDHEPVFRAEIDRCARILEPLLGFDLRSALADWRDPAEQHDPDAAPRRHRPFPMVVATEYALAKLLMSVGIKPSAFIGHSLGEYTAACLADVLPLEVTLPLVVERERLLRSVGEGGLSLSVSCSEAEIRKRLTPQLSIAAINAADMCVVSGWRDDIVALEHALEADGVEYRRLPIGGAAHSALLEPVLDQYQKLVAGIALSAPRLPYVSSLTGTWITPEQAVDPVYWRRHTREPVRFADGIDEIARMNRPILLEVGPGQALRKLVERHTGGTLPAMTSMRHARAEVSDLRFFLETLGQLWTAGVAIDWNTLHAGSARRVVPLPGYPFSRQRYWIDPRPSTEPEHEAHVRSLLATPGWRSLSRAAHAVPAAARWLVFADSHGIAEVLAKHSEIVLVRRGSGYEHLGPREYTIDPSSPGDHARLVGELQRRAEPIDALIYLFSADVDPRHGLEAASALRICARALAQHGRPVPVWVCSNEMFDVTGDERTSAEKQLVLGAFRAVSSEYPSSSWRLIDVVLAGNGHGAAIAAQRIAGEIAAERRHPVVALRGERSWIPTWDALPVSETAGAQVPPEGTVYFVPGGLDDVRFRFTAHAAAAGPSPHLVISDELPVPDQATWDHWLARAGDGTPVANAGSAAFAVDLSSERAAIEAIERRLRGEIELEPVPAELEAELNRLCPLYVLDYFRRMGLDTAPGSTHTRDSIAARLRVLPKYQKFLDAMLAMLHEDRFVVSDGEQLRFVASAPAGEAERLRHDLAVRFPGFAVDIAANDDCVHHYPEALSGEIGALQVIMPDGDYERLRPVIDKRIRSSDMMLFRPLIAEVVARLVDRAGSNRVRILEVGAGRGDLTWIVANALRGRSNVEYHFTDLGRAFVLGGQRRAAESGFDFMKFGVLDISRDPASQGYELGSFDIVLAFNVLHATRSVRESLHHVRNLLVQQGMVFILEAARPRRWLTMAAGLAEGWWYFEDDLRQHSPLMEADHWIRALEDEGYEHVTACPDAERRAGSDYAMIVGQKPGVDTSESLHVHAVQQRIRRVRLLEALGARVSVVPADRNAADRALALAGGRFDAALHVIGAPDAEPDPETVIAELSGLPALCRRLLVIRDLRRGPKGSAAAELVASYAAARAAMDRGQVWSYIEWDEPGVDPEAIEHVRGTRGFAAFQCVLPQADQPLVRVAPLYAKPAPGVEDARTPSAEASVAGPASAFNRRPHMETAFVAPSNELETTIAKIWEEQLGLDRVGIHDGLYELGGDSLLVGRIVAKLRDAIGVNLSMRKFLENPTVAGVAAEIESLRQTAGSDGERGITRSARRSRGAKVQP